MLRKAKPLAMGLRVKEESFASMMDITFARLGPDFALMKPFNVTGYLTVQKMTIVMNIIVRFLPQTLLSFKISYSFYKNLNFCSFGKFDFF